MPCDQGKTIGIIRENVLIFLFYEKKTHMVYVWQIWSQSPICVGKSARMMTSSNGNIFRVTDPLCGEFTGLGEIPAQRPVTRGFDVFFDLRLNKRLSKQPWGWWSEMPSWSLWRQCNWIPSIYKTASFQKEAMRTQVALWFFYDVKFV